MTLNTLSPAKNIEDTIVALATPAGNSAIAVIRLSGKHTIPITNQVFKGKDLSRQKSHTIHFGEIYDEDKLIDEVLVSLFIAPHSFTKEDAVEISCHGSQYIVNQIIKLLIRQGARPAMPGEFTQRAFLNGRFDLAQAEAIADLIASESEAAHRTALHQMRGGFSKEISSLREKLIHFASMVELELDFAEEDVAFASRDDLKKLIFDLLAVINTLIESFDRGNVIKNGISTVIVGKPNVGKSTLLNVLLHEEKAIVSDIPGTTRDFIEDEIDIEGIRFRLTDTAGLRKTADTIEAMGIARTQEKIQKASLVIYLFDPGKESIDEAEKYIQDIDKEGITLLKVANKTDLVKPEILNQLKKAGDVIPISATMEEGIEALKSKMLAVVNVAGFQSDQTIITNIRHYNSLLETRKALHDVCQGIDQNISGDLLALDIRTALHHLGLITGEVSVDDLLDNIFSKFCIGK